MRDRVYGFSCYWSGFSVFLWLALVVAGDPQGLPITGVPQGTSVGVTNAGSADFITRYIISIGLLLAGLRVASEVGGSAAHIVGKGNANWLQCRRHTCWETSGQEGGWKTASTLWGLPGGIRSGLAAKREANRSPLV